MLNFCILPNFRPKLTEENRKIDIVYELSNSLWLIGGLKFDLC